MSEATTAPTRSQIIQSLAAVLSNGKRNGATVVVHVDGCPAFPCSCFPYRISQNDPRPAAQVQAAIERLGRWN